VRAVRPVTPGFPNDIEIVDLPEPEPGAGEVVVRVAAAGLNRADLLQMRGGYPPPPGESAIPGLECAGRIEKLGRGVTSRSPGDRVMALLSGGGQAELVAVPEGQLMTWPVPMSAAEAGGLPEAALTAWTNLVVEGGLRSGETVLVTGATSGVGSFAVQLARELGARVIAAGRDEERLEALSSLGAKEHVVLNETFADDVHAITGGRGVDLVLDLVGGEWTGRAIDALAPHGRLVLVGLTAGTRAHVDLAHLLRRQLRVAGSLLRPRSRDEKGSLVRAFSDFAAPRMQDGRLKPVVHATFPLAEAASAYAALAAGGFTGKLVLTMGA